MTVGEETRLPWPQVKESWGSPETDRGKEPLSPRSSRGSVALGLSDLGAPILIADCGLQPRERTQSQVFS